MEWGAESLTEVGVSSCSLLGGGEQKNKKWVKYDFALQAENAEAVTEPCRQKWSTKTSSTSGQPDAVVGKFWTKSLHASFTAS